MDTLEKLLQLGRTREAKGEAKKRLEADASDAVAMLTLVKVMLVDGERAEASALLLKLEAKGETADTVIARGNLAIQQGEPKVAREKFQRAITLAPTRAEAWFGLGVVQAASREYDESVKSFARAVELEPKSGIFHYHLAVNLLELKRPEEAVPHATEAVQRNPLHPQAYQLLARMLLIAGKAPKAHALLKEGLKLLPNNPLLLSELANVDLVGGNVGGAFHATAQLAKKHPEDAAAMANHALLLLAQQRWAEVMEICGRFEKAGQSTAPLKCIEATVYEAKSPADLKNAQRCYEEAMQLDRGDWVAANNLGQLLMRCKDEAVLPRAVTVLEEACHRKPGQLEPMLNLALAYARADEKRKSVAVAKAILQFGPAKNDPVRQQAERLISALG